MALGLLKRFLHALARSRGYMILPISNAKAMREDLIREILGLYQTFQFNDLPERDRRIPLLAELLGTSVGEAIHVIHYLHKSLTLPGDVCEFGVAQGATSALIANEIRHANKCLWLFDSFEGLPKPSEKDQLKDDIFNFGSMAAYQGTMSYRSDLVKERLRQVSFPPELTRIVPGYIEDTIHQSTLPKSVCFAYVDFDFYEPILTALNYLRHTIPVGGHIIVDDYDWFSTGAKAAVDEFVASNSNYTLSLPHPTAGHFCILQRQQ